MKGTAASEKYKASPVQRISATARINKILLMTFNTILEFINLSILNSSGIRYRHKIPQRNPSFYKYFVNISAHHIKIL